jgi:hypothetical protein
VRRRLPLPVDTRSTIADTDFPATAEWRSLRLTGAKRSGWRSLCGESASKHQTVISRVAERGQRLHAEDGSEGPVTARSGDMADHAASATPGAAKSGSVTPSAARFLRAADGVERAGPGRTAKQNGARFAAGIANHAGTGDIPRAAPAASVGHGRTPPTVTARGITYDATPRLVAADPSSPPVGVKKPAGPAR